MPGDAGFTGTEFSPTLEWVRRKVVSSNES